MGNKKIFINVLNFIPDKIDYLVLKRYRDSCRHLRAVLIVE